jgi:sialate O-acetylesterase
MVLQQDMPIRIWGTSNPGEQVKATLGGEYMETTSRENGRWELVFKPRKASKTPIDLVINDLVFSDILIGEVWICSGQSNMAFPVNKSLIPDQGKLVENNQLRYLKLTGPRAIAREGYTEEELARCNSTDFFKGYWSKSIKEIIPRFSAVGWTFAQLISTHLNVPVGIIEIAVGGSAINNWLPPDIARSHPYTKHLYEGDWLKDSTVNINHRKRAKEAFQEILVEGDPYIPGRMKYRWMCEPGFLYEAGIDPLAGLSVRGMVWYQGESDAIATDQIMQYPELFEVFVESVRNAFHHEKMPVLYVQLPGYRVASWPLFREQQRQIALKNPDMYMAVAIDIGEEENIHYPDKAPVGERLAALALGNVYDEPASPSFPVLKKIKTKPGNILLIYKGCGSGLQPVGEIIPHFEISGADSVFKKVDARIVNGKKVELKTGDIEPVFIRYAWTSFPDPPVSLVNEYNLPAGPFLVKTLRYDD